MEEDELDFIPKDPAARYAWEANFLSKIDGVAIQLGLDMEMVNETKKSLEASMRTYEQLLEAKDREDIALQKLKLSEKKLSGNLTQYILKQKHGTD